jgi:hypothetical protein
MKRRMKLKKNRKIYVDFSKGTDKPQLMVVKGGDVESASITKKVANLLRECGIAKLGV